MRSRSRPILGRKPLCYALRIFLNIVLVAVSCGCGKLAGKCPPHITVTTLDKAGSVEILYVMDPGAPDFEEVPIDDLAKLHLLPWVWQLKDELTRSISNPTGQDLRVPSPYREACCLFHVLKVKDSKDFV